MRRFITQAEQTLKPKRYPKNKPDIAEKEFFAERQAKAARRKLLRALTVKREI